MKKIISAAVILMSVNCFAVSMNGGAPANPLIVSSLSPFMTTLVTSELSRSHNKELATQILNDSQHFIQSGEMSVLLNSEITNVIAQDNALSTEEALDLLVNASEQILK